MPQMDGITATAALRRLDPPPQVIVLTTFQTDEHVVAALRAGASGFLVKDTPPAEIIHAVRLVAAGDAIVSPSVTRTLLSHFGNTAETSERYQRSHPTAGRPHRSGAGGGNSSRCRRLQRRNRGRPLHERGDGQGARVTAAQQARPQQPGADSDPGARRRPSLRPSPSSELCEVGTRLHSLRTMSAAWFGGPLLSTLSRGT